MLFKSSLNKKALYIFKHLFSVPGIADAVRVWWLKMIPCIVDAKEVITWLHISGINNSKRLLWYYEIVVLKRMGNNILVCNRHLFSLKQIVIYSTPVDIFIGIESYFTVLKCIWFWSCIRNNIVYTHLIARKLMVCSFKRNVIVLIIEILSFLR